MAIIILCIPFCYLQIYKKVIKTTKDSRNKNVYQMERLTFLRSVSVTGFFFVCWSPEFLLILYEFITGISASVELYILSSFGVVLHSAINPLLIASLDKHIQRCIFEFLNLYSQRVANPLEAHCTHEFLTELAPADTLDNKTVLVS